MPGLTNEEIQVAIDALNSYPAGINANYWVKEYSTPECNSSQHAFIGCVLDKPLEYIKEYG